MMKQGFIIPVYRHAATTGLVVEKIIKLRLPVIIVDDGNNREDRECLEELAAKTPGVTLTGLKKNSGKGGAVLKGLEKAAELGLSHVLQIDADGQHDEERAAFFLAESAKHPESVICGFPEFDENAPRSRVIGRKISNFWASVVTLSNDLKDVLCGFRVYPVEAVLRASKSPFIDKRMGFDVEILVRLCWNRVPFIYHPIKISYPKDGVSNFHNFSDNLRISWMFTRLCTGMFLRMPLILFSRGQITRRGERQ